MRYRLRFRHGVTKKKYDREAALNTRIASSGDLRSVLKSKVTARFFADEDQRAVFAWLKKQYQKHGRVPSLGAVLDEFPDFEPEFVSDGTDQVIEFVRERRIYADVRKAIDEVVKSMREDPREGLRVMRRKVTEISVQHSDDVEDDITRDVSAVSDAYQLRKKKKGLIGIPYPWKKVNEASHGMQDGEFIGIYGPPGTMKTWLLLFILWFAWTYHKKRILLVTQEMPIAAIQMRFATLHAEVDYKKFQDGALSEEDEVRLYDALDELEESSGFVVMEFSEVGMAAISSIEAKIEELDPDLVGIDGFGYLAADGEWGSFMDVCKGTKTILAMRHKKPILVTHHANRDRKKKVDSADALDVAQGDVFFRYVDNLYRLNLQPIHRDQKELEIVSKKMREGAEHFKMTIHAKPSYDFSQKFVATSPSEGFAGDDDEITG